MHIIWLYKKDTKIPMVKGSESIIDYKYSASHQHTPENQPTGFIGGNNEIGVEMPNINKESNKVSDNIDEKNVLHENSDEQEDLPLDDGSISNNRQTIVNAATQIKTHKYYTEEEIQRIFEVPLPTIIRECTLSTEDKLVSMDDKLKTVDDKMKSMDDKMNSVDDRVKAVDDEMKSVNDKMNSVDEKMNSVDDEMKSVNDKMKFVDEKIVSLEMKLDQILSILHTNK